MPTNDAAYRWRVHLWQRGRFCSVTSIRRRPTSQAMNGPVSTECEACITSHTIIGPLPPPSASHPSWLAVPCRLHLQRLLRRRPFLGLRRNWTVSDLCQEAVLVQWNALAPWPCSRAANEEEKHATICRQPEPAVRRVAFACHPDQVAEFCSGMNRAIDYAAGLGWIKQLNP
jgi:hypothetical protein